MTLRILLLVLGWSEIAAGVVDTAVHLNGRRIPNALLGVVAIGIARLLRDGLSKASEPPQ
jgi:hypothetical protein